MDINRIQKLIDLYWDGLTSVDEEREICSFFEENNNLPEDLEQWREWFAVKYSIGELELDDEFDVRILSDIKKDAVVKKRVKLKRIVWSSVASVAIILLAVFSWVKTDQTVIVTDRGISAEEQRDYEMVKELLFFTSSTMNKTEEVLGENLSKINVINKYVNIK